MKIPVPNALVSLLLVAVYRLLCRTLRLEISGGEHLRRAWAEGRQVVFACWHNELFCFPWMGRGVAWIREQSRWVGIVSASRDGDVLAGVLERQGIAAARGSSSRQGLRALMSAVRIMKKEGRQGFVTVDGPRGPRHEVKDGVLLLAHKAGALIVPARVRPDRCWTFARAWDRFELPKPFSRCKIVFGEPYALSCGDKLTTDDLDRERATLQEKLNGLG